MARVNIPAQSLLGSYPQLPFAPGGADLLFTATDDPVSRSAILLNAKTSVLVYNTDSVSHAVTFTSVADPLKRSGDIANYVVAAGAVALFGPFQTTGWSSNGSLYIDVSSAMLRLAIVNIP